MKYLRALTLICFGFGLFVQVAAQAAAMPQVQMPDLDDCAEMVDSMPMQMGEEEEPADRTGPCRDLSLGCLVPMNCVPPLALTDLRSIETSMPITDKVFVTLLARQLDSQAIVPESPPPQTILTV